MAKKRGTRPKAKRQVVRAGDLLPEGYEEFLGELKERIRTARLRAPSPPTVNSSSSTGTSAGRSSRSKRPAAGAMP